MAQEIHKCRHCDAPFVSFPGKPGYIDECPECLVERVIRAQPAIQAKRPMRAKRAMHAETPELSQMELLLKYVATHPVTVNVRTGEVVKWKTRLELRQNLKRKGYSPITLDKLVFAYMESFED